MENTNQNSENASGNEKIFVREDLYKKYEEKLSEADSKREAKKAKKQQKPRSKRRNIIKALAIIIALAVILGAASAFLLPKLNLGGAGGATAVSVGEVTRGDVEEIIDVKGEVGGSEKAEITSSLNYEITQILVSEGDRVSKGQVLAVLDSGNLIDDYRKAQLQASEAKRIYDTKLSLYNEGALAKDDVLTAKSAYEEAAITVSSFDGLDNTKIKSPISGTVTRVNVTVGRNPSDTDGQPMFVVENLDRLQMNVKIGEYDISKIKVGQTAEISSQVLGDKTVSGEVTKISPTGEKKADSTEMVIPVTISINSQDSGLIAGVTAKAGILVAKSEKTLVVPSEALMQDAQTGKTCIFTVSKDNTLKKVFVETGVEAAFNVEVITKKVNEGDKVVLSPTQDMTDNMTVKIDTSGQIAE
ncbi:MAG: efflux RND transporter periplasmic adaptor subunit [Clostridia bacterium]|nr:efflux RND transporter periplasmic adaptor subunit [Clostridia bacterium]